MRQLFELKKLFFLLVLSLFVFYPQNPPEVGAQSSSRDPLKWPFASNSIWNMPIGSNASYVAANLDPNVENFAWPTIPQAGEELIILEPAAPLTNVYRSSVGWTSENRCNFTAPQTIITQINIPASFIIPDTINGAHLDNAATVLSSDGRTLQQLVPLTHCSGYNYATALEKILPDVDIYGDGMYGSRGGSGLSSFGGSIRLGELRPGQTGMRHALKMGVDAKTWLSRCDGTTNPCYRWPARWGDGYGPSLYGTYNNNTNNALKMGALLAIPASTDINSLGLQTEPGKQIAWTLQNYGAYIVDSEADPNTGFMLENGSAGSKLTEFYNDYGYNFRQNGYRTAGNPAYNWQQDIIKIIRVLHVVDNNTSTSIGGGGTPRQPLAPPLTPPGGSSITITPGACIQSPNTGNEVTISWTDSTVSYVDIGIDANFTTFYNKRVTGSTSTNASGGFNIFQGTTPLSFTPNSTYYVRTYNGAHSSTVTFTTGDACSAPPTPASSENPIITAPPSAPPPPTATPPPPSDLNHDGVVNDSDTQILFASWGRTDLTNADIDKDGKVNGSDYAILLSQWQ